MKEAFSALVFLSGLSLIVMGVVLYGLEGSLANGKIALASGIWLELCWVHSLQEKITRQ